MAVSSMTTLSEADVEQVALDWLQTSGWSVAHGPDIAPDAPPPNAPATTRSSWHSVCAKPS